MAHFSQRASTNHQGTVLHHIFVLYPAIRLVLPSARVAGRFRTRPAIGAEMFQITLSILDPFLLSLVHFLVEQVVIRSVLDVQTVFDSFGSEPMTTCSGQVFGTRECLSKEVFVALLRLPVALDDGPRPLQGNSGRWMDESITERTKHLPARLRFPRFR